MGKTHAAAGALFTAAILPPVNEVLDLGLGPGELIVGVGIGTVAGLLPDIDHPDSLLTKGKIPGAKFLGPLGRVAGYLLSIPPRIVGVPARGTMNHRGGTHSVTFMMGWTFLAAPFYALVAVLAALILAPIFAALTGILPNIPQIDTGQFADWIWSNLPSVMPLVCISVFSGYLAHLVTDSMTNVPVPWFWPFTKKRYSLLPKGLRITTGSMTENWLVRPFILLLLAAAFVWNIGMPLGAEAVERGKSELQGPEKQEGKKAKNKDEGKQAEKPKQKNQAQKKQGKQKKGKKKGKAKKQKKKQKK